jgi:hypothetical protein
MKKLQKMLNETAELQTFGSSYADAYTMIKRSYPQFNSLLNATIDFIDKEGITGIEDLEGFELNLSSNNSRFIQYVINA